ncbi:MAG: hypothetical protein U0325_33250 [Polyangiales bacterium]
MTPPRALALLMACGACLSPLTQVVVVLDTDLTPVTDVDTVRVVVRRQGATGAPAHDVQYDLRSNRFRFPGTLTVVARDPDDARPLEVLVTARRGNTERLSLRALARPTADVATRLDLYLARRCLDGATPCDAASTCGRRGCEAVERGALPSWTP